MKKFNINSKNLATIAFTCIVWLCVLIAAAYVLQGNNIYLDAIAALAWLCIAGFFEWLKYKICNHDDTLNTLD